MELFDWFYNERVSCVFVRANAVDNVECIDARDCNSGFGFFADVVFVIVFWFVRGRVNCRGKMKTFGLVVFVSFSSLLLGLAGMGYTDFINAIFSGQEIRLAKGRVEKIEPRRRYGPRVDVFDGKSTINNIPVTDEEYRALHLGGHYVGNMRMGALGFYYRWRVDSWNRNWEARAAGEKPSIYKG
ncbi:hypothetical protein [Burkholderia sp. BCC1977]|uniref:hypothetical protein n=1 Tax=Burkholderia sp. BCC1977 TaxID=2817440 RepID=UPI002ABD2612|nr:hypothetical protein [Burkholderia sp. BCC1977]